MALDRLKPAARAVRQLQLGSEFPNVEAMYRQRSLSRLLNKRLWSVALSYAGSDVALQVRGGDRQCLSVLSQPAMLCSLAAGRQGPARTINDKLSKDMQHTPPEGSVQGPCSGQPACAGCCQRTHQSQLHAQVPLQVAP